MTSCSPMGLTQRPDPSKLHVVKQTLISVNTTERKEQRLSNSGLLPSALLLTTVFGDKLTNGDKTQKSTEIEKATYLFIWVTAGLYDKKSEVAV